MAKGDIGKQQIINKIKEAFGDDFVGVVDKKVYLWTKEGGEKIQIALTLTATKTPITPDGAPAKTGSLDFGGGLDFEAMDGGSLIPSKQTEITEDEKNNIAELMKKLGL
jgi:hypothetical protein